MSGQDLILEKLKELHIDNKKMGEAIDEIKITIAKLEINSQETNVLREWKKDVSDVWSASNMAEAQKQIYIQKGKWSTVYGVILAIQVVWLLVLAYLKSKG